MQDRHSYWLIGKLMELQIKDKVKTISIHKIVVVEPQPLVCEGFKFVLSQNDSIEIERCDSLSNLGSINRRMFYCINIESLTKNELTQVLDQFTKNDIRHLFYSINDNPNVRMLAAYAIQNGAMGMLIDLSPDVAKLAFSKISNFENYYCETSEEIKWDSNMQMHSSENLLTARETEVLKSLALGKSNKDVAVDLDISVRTVETHRSRIMNKLQAKSFADLVRYALNNQMV